MALAALIAAYHDSGEDGALRATLPLAGRTLIERQVRLAAGAGANPIVVVVERIPPALGAALDRLRRDQLPLVVARTAEEAAEAVDPFDRLLLIADGAIVDPGQISQIAARAGESVLTVPDTSFGEVHERIDAYSRWAGLATISGALLRETSSVLRDWDLQSTLLRRALQGGAQTLAADGPVAIIDRFDDLAGLERQILAAASTGGDGWAARLLAPLERRMAALLMPSPLSPTLVGTLAALLGALAAIFFLYGWLWIGLVLILAATPLEGAAQRLAKLRMQDDERQSWWTALLPLFGSAALVALGLARAEAGDGWGMVLLALTTLTFMLALRIEKEGKRIRGALFLAERKGMAWLLLPFALFGLWSAGLAFLFAYAAASFFWTQREVHAGSPAPPGL